MKEDGSSQGAKIFLRMPESEVAVHRCDCYQEALIGMT